MNKKTSCDRETKEGRGRRARERGSEREWKRAREKKVADEKDKERELQEKKFPEVVDEDQRHESM